LYVDEFNSRFVVGEEHERPRRSRAKPQRNRRFETSVVLVALVVIGVLAIVVIAAWKSSGGGKTPPPTTPVTKTAKRPAALLTIVPLRGTTHLTVRRGSASGDIAFDGTLLRTDAAVAFRGAKLWVQITAPENVRVLVKGQLLHVPGYQPRVLIVTPSGWRFP
jgi:hypothetical protein